MPYHGGGSSTTGAVTSGAVLADNAIVRGDGGGQAVQDSAITIADAAASNVTVATTAGNALTVNVTAPAATTGASQVGRAASITASNAVASTDTAGAAAGGAINLTSGNAARNASGNAAGGDINLVTGTGIGTGVAGAVVVPAGASGAPSLRWSGSTTGFFSRSANKLDAVANAIDQFELGSGTLDFQSALVVGFTNGGVAAGADTSFSRSAANVLAMSTGDWFQFPAGNKRVASDATNATTTMANLTDLTVSLYAGRKYSGKLILYCADSVAAEGFKIDFDGGTATMTSFRAHGTVFDTALLLSSQTTALATDFAVATLTGDSMIEVYFSLVCNAAGTFIPRFAQNTHATGTATVYTNSYMCLEDMP